MRWRQARSCRCSAGQDNEVRRLQTTQPAIEARKPRGHTGDAAVMVKRQPGTFGSLAQHLGQCLKPASRVSRLGEPEQTAFGLLDDRHGAVLLLQPGLIRMT